MIIKSLFSILAIASFTFAAHADETSYCVGISGRPQSGVGFWSMAVTCSNSVSGTKYYSFNSGLFSKKSDKQVFEDAINTLRSFGYEPRFGLSNYQDSKIVFDNSKSVGNRTKELVVFKVQNMRRNEKALYLFGNTQGAKVKPSYVNANLAGSAYAELNRLSGLSSEELLVPVINERTMLDNGYTARTLSGVRDGSGGEYVIFEK